ncbi:Protein of unknown function [Gracilibacillus ureilyticus]|uniref:DUF2515 domain-containing protein n=1 Tax=Gracilibacillus ureilyticus TaxID=531814 RepID=A0A1H9M6D5_9BACI|nr:DUF2515 family protein [Gracilibacillus ureilyticus]SER19258.1 Protein of unknown function [Gracilibacillus ureilyticus]
MKALKKALKKLHPLPSHPSALSVTEKEIIHSIEKETVKHNINNITRTNAYLEFYKQCPEIKWAFLAHMVSRNAGWNMTDLKGSFLKKLLSPEQQEYFFSFLERSNWLIFQDAYPQLLLYLECKKRQNNYFHLLRNFGISLFMEAVWNHYYQNGNNDLISVALIINEQHYIENRVVHNPEYQATLFESVEFMLQEWLELNQILFPYRENAKSKAVGLSVHHFAAVQERILLGKRLYHLLFHPDYYAKITDFAINQPHTGSRKDFSQELFHDIDESSPYESVQARLDNCQLLPGSMRIYSPKLTDVWENVPQKPAEKEDWYTDWRVIKYLQKEHNGNIIADIQKEYCEGLKKLELAVLAKQKITKAH